MNKRNSPLAISGILARDEAKFHAAQSALRHRAGHFTDAGSLLASGIDSVLILLPNHLHLEFARAALERNLDVFCEKPLTQNVADARALIGIDGIGCEPASAASLAGARKLVEAGVIAPDADVVLVLTGHVLKDGAYSVRYHQSSAAFSNRIIAVGDDDELRTRINDMTASRATV